MPDPAHRAAAAEHSVGELFRGRVAGMPGTHIGRITYPSPSSAGQPWHYWWQAHYLDAIVDAAERHLGQHDRSAAKERVREADRLVTTIWLRNLGRFRNAYYDDMAWVALALGRLERLHLDLGGDNRGRLLDRGMRELTAQLRAGTSDELGGGVWWNTSRDFKNVPATGPVALHLARAGDRGDAARLVDWMYNRLFDEETGLFVDGVRVEGGRERVVTDVYSYNQGTVLGALDALGDPTSLRRAGALVAAVAERLTTEHHGGLTLVTHGGGDGGLFTGILARYLGLVAGAADLDDETRSTATRLVTETADALWQGRDERRTARRVAVVVFSPDPVMPAASSQPTGTPVELSTQLQAWMILEAAARLDR